MKDEVERDRSNQGEPSNSDACLTVEGEEGKWEG